MRKEDKPVTVNETFTNTISEVWNAITVRDEMVQWFFDNIPAFEAEAGIETQFNIVSGERNFMHMWKVTEVVSRKRITYNWKYKDYAGDAFVTFELTGNDGDVKLILTMKIVEDFPDDIPEFTRESCVGGWVYFINGSLKNYLSNL